MGWMAIAVVWVGIAVLCIAVTRFIKGDDFEAEGDIPPCVMWPLCVALIVPLGAGWFLFYWMPVKSADFLRVLSQRVKQRHRRSVLSPTPSDWRQPDQEITTPDWRQE